ANPEVYESYAVDLAVTMARLFGDELDRKTLWSRIATGLEQAARENANDAQALVNACLLHVKADAGQAAANPWLLDVLLTLPKRDANWQRQWARWIISHIHVVIVKARHQWQKIKEEK